MPSRQVLLSLPPAMAARFHELEGRDRADYFASFDEGGPLGSGGGIAGLLAEAWRANAGSHPFEEWLCERPRLAILSGGQSRRLPSYACVGKVLAPMPYQAADGPAAPGHNLLDRILASLKPLLDRLPSSYPLVVASGDALTIFRDLPELPNVDALGFGFDAGVATAGRHGTFFLPRGTRDLDFFLQKPAPERIRELDPTHQYLVDTGVWAFSARAAMALMGECGWSGERFLDGRPRRYELYTDFATALGLNPCRRHESVSELSAAVLPAGGAFHHFGTSRQLIDFTNRLSGSEEAIVQNATRLVKGDAVWVENSDLPADPFLEGENVLTNLPDPNWLPRLSKGVCLDFVPVGKEDWCLRFYGFDDPFAGEPSQASLLGRPVLDWFRKRGLESWEGDLQEAPLFPVLPADRISHEFIAWLTAAEPEGDHASMWRVTRRLSAQDLLREAEVGRIYSQRRELRTRFLKSLLRDRPREALRHIDLEALAATGVEVEVQERLDPLLSIRVPMLKSAAMRRRGDPGWEEAEAESFRILRELILRRERFAVEPPRDTLLKDQIVWGRSPLRMDLAGGWTDTPPYCMLYGGRVMNVAVELNGQPPVQVFGRVIDELVIVLRSLDVGTEKRISTYEELEGSLAVGSEFALAQAALVLSGFSREFCPGAETSLERQLARFGGGLEINVLAAVPKGSGLGTSSILSAAILGALGSICGHGWDEQAVFDRVLASEQFLTTGGGWQDQAGGVLHGMKELTTPPGIEQRITCRWLPERALAGHPGLLYYTGIKRVAKDVLREIVRGMFLNASSRLSVLRDIGDNVETVVDAVRQGSYEGLGRAIARSWKLNKALDPGTNPPEVDRVIHEIEDLVLGAKLLGAGGGGFLLMLPKDEAAGRRIREKLKAADHPGGARFVDFAVAQKGLDVTRS